MAASAYYDLTQQVYISYFGRPADPRGLEAFATGLSNANAPTTIGELNTAYKTNPAIKSLVDSFATSTESATLYGSADTDTFINSIFLNVLNRPAKLEGLNFWNTEISSGRVTKAGAALAIMAGAYANTTAQGLSDQAVINNKVAVANSFTTGIDTVEELIAYKGAAAANTARNMLHNVVETTTVTGFQATVDATLTNLVNQVANATGQTFNLTLSTDAVTGTAGNDTIVANYDVQNGAHTVSGLDNIDGGNGTDTLRVTDAQGGTVDLSLLTVKGVEKLNLTSVGGLVGNAADVSTFNGLTDASFVVKGGVQTITAADTTNVTVSNSTGGATIVGGKSIDLTVGNSAALAAASTAAATASAAANAKVAALTTLANAVAAAANNAAVTTATAAAVTAGAITASQKTSIDAASVSVSAGDAPDATELAAAAAIITPLQTAATTVQTAATAAATAALNAANAAQIADAVVATQNSALTSATVKNGSTVVITDASTDSNTLTTVSLDNNSGAATLTGKAIASVSVANTSQNVTIVNGTAKHTEAIWLNNVTGATVTDDVATTVNVSTTTKKSTGVSLNAAAATALTIDAAVETGFTAVTAAADKTIVIKGAGAVTIGSGSTLTALESVDASASTGGLTLGVALGNAVAFTGGSGKDALTVGATTKAINTGAGDDTVTLSGATLGTNGAIDAGTGNDTLVLTAANAATATAGTNTLAAAVTGFEQLSLTGTTNQVVDLANLDNINYVALDAGNGVALNNFATGGTLVLNTGATAVTVAIKDALTTTADVLNVSVSNAAGQALGTITANDVETVKFATDDAADKATGIAHSVTLTDTAVKTITVAGDAGLNLGTVAGTALTSFDASGVTKGLVTLTTGALTTAATIKGGADANTINFAAATKAVTYTGGAGVDNINAGNAADNSISTGAGNDIVVLGSGKNTVDAGAGDDTITFGANLNVATGGAGTDHFVVGTVTNGNTYSTIADFAVGEDISFGGTSTAGALGAKIALGATAAFADFLNAASTGTSGSDVEWFTFGGDTYVVVDNSAAVTYQNGTDQIVKLTGTVDLSASTITVGGVLTFVAA